MILAKLYKLRKSKTMYYISAILYDFKIIADISKTNTKRSKTQAFILGFKTST